MERLPNDAYFTPDWLVGLCVGHVLPTLLRQKLPGRVLDPGAGEGAFIRQLRTAYPAANVTAIDIVAYPWQADTCVTADFLGATFDAPFDLVVGNPPFSLALSFITKSLSLSENVCFLLRQGFLASAKRAAFFREHRPLSVHIVPNRPVFYGESSDKADYCFICWRRGFRGTTQMHWLPTLPDKQRKQRAA